MKICFGASSAFLVRVRVCMQDTFARARTLPPGQACATIWYVVYKVRVMVRVRVMVKVWVRVRFRVQKDSRFRFVTSSAGVIWEHT